MLPQTLRLRVNARSHWVRRVALVAYQFVSKLTNIAEVENNMITTSQRDTCNRTEPLWLWIAFCIEATLIDTETLIRIHRTN